MDCFGQYQTKVHPNEKSHPKQVIWWNEGPVEPRPLEIEAQHSFSSERPSTPLIGSLTIMVERRLSPLEARVGNRKNVMAITAIGRERI
jgi:hypothetical protein